MEEKKQLIVGTAGTASHERLEEMFKNPESFATNQSVIHAMEITRKWNDSLLENQLLKIKNEKLEEINEDLISAIDSFVEQYSKANFFGKIKLVFSAIKDTIRLFKDLVERYKKK